MKRALVVMGIGLVTFAGSLVPAASAGDKAKAHGSVSFVNNDEGTGETKLHFNQEDPLKPKKTVKVQNMETGAKYTAAIDCINFFGDGLVRMTGEVVDGNRSGFFTLSVRDTGKGKDSHDLVAVNRRESMPFDCTVPREPDRVVSKGQIKVKGLIGDMPVGPMRVMDDRTEDEVED